MNYIEQLKTASKKYKSIVCMGLDPLIDRIPVEKGSIKEKIVFFYEEILNRVIQKGDYPGAVKPNYAYYAQYGFEGLEALFKIIELYKSQDIPVILDAKRGDISTTAAAYARECFDFFKADAVTLAPYMGYDSISPFVNNFPGKGYYILCKTSNKTSADFQDILTDDKPVFIHAAKKIVEWHASGMGAVAGATFPEQLNEISEVFIDSGKEIPLLLPGIGSQGGDLKEVITILKKYPDINIHRINSSSGINYAYREYTDMDFADAAVEALKKLNSEINEIIN
ncbi:MAG: orotidine-5'-phosphate decarboxylase [Spirochaetes bacterium]|nr:orotidine-5'-phosphate decarboxylase [Spirochaetota bacterium]